MRKKLIAVFALGILALFTPVQFSGSTGTPELSEVCAQAHSCVYKQSSLCAEAAEPVFDYCSPWQEPDCPS